MKSIIRELFKATAAATDTLSAEFNPQRLVDEIGALQVLVNQDPDPGGGGGSLGKVAIEGKIHKDATFTEITNIPLDDFDGGSGSGLTDVEVLPYMRAAMREDGGGFSVTGGTTISTWFME